MLQTAKFVVGSGIHTKHINTLCGQNVQIWMLHLLIQVQVTSKL